MKHHSTFIFEKKNYLIMAIGLIVIALGFITMSGGGSDIHLAPALVLLGFAIEIYAILVNPKTDKKQEEK